MDLAFYTCMQRFIYRNWFIIIIIIMIINWSRLSHSFYLTILSSHLFHAYGQSLPNYLQLLRILYEFGVLFLSKTLKGSLPRDYKKRVSFLIDCKCLCLKSYDKQTPARTIIRNVVSLLRRSYATRSQLRKKSLFIFSCAIDPSAFSFFYAQNSLYINTYQKFPVRTCHVRIFSLAWT